MGGRNYVYQFAPRAMTHSLTIQWIRPNLVFGWIIGFWIISTIVLSAIIAPNLAALSLESSPFPPTFPLLPQETSTNLHPVVWGADSQDQTNIPTNATGIIQMEASSTGNHILALKVDGTILAWGATNKHQTDVPAGLTNVVQVAAGSLNSLALRSDGTAELWGGNANGQCDIPAGLTNIVQIEGGLWHSLALLVDGTVQTWGDDSYGQTDVPEGLTNVIQITAGALHNVALLKDGSVVAWGDDFYGQTDVPAGLTNVVQLAAGDSHTLALRSDGTVVAWGASDTNMEACCGQSLVPSGLTNIIQVAAGGYHSLALRNDGTVTAWGDDGSGQCDPPPNLTNVVQITAGKLFSVALAAPAIQSLGAFEQLPPIHYPQITTVQLTNLPTSSTGLPVTYRVKSGPAVLSGNLLTITGLGTITLAANQPGNLNYLPAKEVTTSFVSTTFLPQNIVFTPITYVYGSTNSQGRTNEFLITNAIVDSGLPLNYSVAGSNVVALSGNIATVLGVGTATITASQPGNSDYLPANLVSTSFVVTAGSQTLSEFGGPRRTLAVGEPFGIIPPVSSSGLSVNLSVLSGAATLTTIASNPVNLIPSGTGTIILAADQNGYPNYSAAKRVTVSYIVKKRQIIPSFTLGNLVYKPKTTITLKAPKADSGMLSTLSVFSGPASLSSGTKLIVNGAGTITISAVVPETSIYAPSQSTQSSFVVAKAPQVIKPFKIANTTYGKPPVKLPSPIPLPGQTASMDVSGPASWSNGILSFTGAGTVSITASLPGDNNYLPASYTTSFLIAKSAQTIKPFARILNRNMDDGMIQITPPTSSSGNPVTLTVKSGPASLDSDLFLTFSGPGKVILAANQPGDSNFLPAKEVIVSFTVK